MGNNLLVKEFNGKPFHTFVWNNKPCWIASEILSMFDYADSSATISQCIEAEEFELGVEYEVLAKEDLKLFKNMVNELTKVKLVTSELLNKYASSITIFYEDGLYGFLQYTDKPVGVKFRKWVRRDILPEIRQTGSYISDNANPQHLRAKADELESLTTLNDTARIMLPIFDEIGLKPQYKAMALKQIYRKGGIELPIEEIKADRELFDLQTVAKQAGVYSITNKPHAQAVSVIIGQLDIADNEKEVVTFERHGHTGTTIQYTKSVIDKVKQWLNENAFPPVIVGNGKTFKVTYNKEVAVSC